MRKFYTRKQVYRLDQQGIEVDQLEASELMRRAAEASWRALMQRWPDTRRIAVFCGAGNNGGDGFALANIAKKQGVGASVYLLGDQERQSTASRYFLERWIEGGGKVLSWQGELEPCDVIIDALLGIGLSKSLNPDWINLIQYLNAQPQPRISIDIASGLDAGRGVAQPVAIHADLTISFIGRKLGCYIADGPDYCGERVFNDLGVSRAVLASQRSVCTELHPYNLTLPGPRPANSHKFRFGHVLVIGGNRSMSGAVRLAAMAALRSGAGAVSVCVHQDNYALVAAAHPELMVSDWSDLDRLLTQVSLVVVGPGLGATEQTQALLSQLQASSLPMVVDADALRPEFVDALDTTRSSCVFTPHPGEAARLLGSTSSQIQNNRPDALNQLCARWPATWVLKGSGTLVGQEKQTPDLCLAGHPGMATAGSGDVLAGIIAGLLAQGIDPLEAARSGVYLHALAADIYCRSQAQESLIAGDLIESIGQAWLEIKASQERKTLE